VAAENRLTAEELAALAPGDTVTIESGQDFGRRRHTTATVARVDARCVVVRCGPYVESYRLRDGVRDGGVGRAELVNEATIPPVLSREEQQRAQQIDALYREWTRNRADVERLQRLHEAIGDSLAAQSAVVK